MNLENFTESVRGIIGNERAKLASLRKIRLVKLGNSAGFAAILISYPPLIYVICFGPSSSPQSPLLVGCVATVFATIPLWWLAGMFQKQSKKI